MELHRVLREQSALSKLYLRGVGPHSGYCVKLPRTCVKTVCDICLDRTGVLKLSCEHFICASCTYNAFDLAAKDESLFPPTCCKRIPLAMALVCLDQELHERYKRKALEFSAENRLYCPVEGCSEFIPQEPQFRFQVGLSELPPFADFCWRCGTLIRSALPEHVSRSNV